MRAVGLKTYIWNNGLRSILLLAGFPFLLAMLAFAVALMGAADDRRGVAHGFRAALAAWPGYLAFGLVVAGLWFLVAWWANQKILDLVTGAHPVTRQDEPRLWNTLENLCIARGLPMPRLAVIETEARNAFASGLRRDRGAVTVTRGLADALDDRELAAVLAHELTHIRNGDARLAVVAAVFAGIISLTAELLLRGVRFGSSSRRNGGSGGAGWLALLALLIAALAWGLAGALRLALSRNREFLADAGSVELTQDADAMITALRKVSGHSDMPGVPAQVRAMFLDDEKGVSPRWWEATHPPLEDRIAALVRYAGGHDPGPLPEPAAPPAPAGAEQPGATPSPWGPLPGAMGGVWGPLAGDPHGAVDADATLPPRRPSPWGASPPPPASPSGGG
ncbi:M48 family metallopeptidase [Roseomonas sp. OT10]|uniref:M48 family metallopeptidase n=1 Tax=Roseomonas cutis TaxID=2897332 RepID=UPI001E458587|nr:M48 family metallopeptidase [Roseomonas sp. OT10]UFN51278.1 M48 family metallopeptidase [Roseomonas sp. OT10]